ncbi:ATP11-domain-containing protein [Rhizodiscina lignyota]|uniref:ATP11-domain-containing protein n=1 Tax=Rhizodiscina lignyota TaxID=1504668 RepID=A0A9P4ICX7_9PEZI|nr:ATP11-domain-containing protein [Rhizodiscina lignyota]
MASFSPACLRQVLRLPSSGGTRLCQRRWAQVHDVRFLATHGAQDRIIAKYRDKLDQKAKEEGLNDIGELKEAYKAKINHLRKKAAVPGATAPLKQATPSQVSSSIHDPPPPPPQPTTESSTSAPSPASATPKPPGIKTLSSYIDIPKTLALPKKEIEYIWRLRHASSADSLCAVIPADIWAVIHANARKHPQFILPLPREGQEGAEIHFLQWAFPAPGTVTVLFTNLAEYKLRGEFSTPHTTVTHHLELLNDKEVVLVQGSVTKGRGVTVEEGKWLLMCLQKFYGLQGEQNESRKKLLEQFSTGDGGFKVEELLEEAEKAV